MTRTVTKKTQSVAAADESDGAYLLKIVLYIVLGSLWLRFPEPLAIGPFMVAAFPFGLLVGLLFASHDHFRVDRKIEYVVLILVTVITLFLPTGIFL